MGTVEVLMALNARPRLGKPMGRKDTKGIQFSASQVVERCEESPH